MSSVDSAWIDEHFDDVFKDAIENDNTKYKEVQT